MKRPLFLLLLTIKGLNLNERRLKSLCNVSMQGIKASFVYGYKRKNVIMIRRNGKRCKYNK